MPNPLTLLRKYNCCGVFLTSWMMSSVQVRSSMMCDSENDPASDCGVVSKFQDNVVLV